MEGKKAVGRVYLVRRVCFCIPKVAARWGLQSRKQVNYTFCPKQTSKPHPTATVKHSLLRNNGSTGCNGMPVLSSGHSDSDWTTQTS